MVIREIVEVFREDTPIEEFKREIKLLERAGYKIYSRSNDYVSFFQRSSVIDANSFAYKNTKIKVHK